MRQIDHHRYYSNRYAVLETQYKIGYSRVREKITFDSGIVMPKLKVVLAIIIIKAVPRTIFGRQKWSPSAKSGPIADYFFLSAKSGPSYSVTGKEFASFKL